jgi:Bacterial transglutaminase-like N-terminal region
VGERFRPLTKYQRFPRLPARSTIRSVISLLELNGRNLPRGSALSLTILNVRHTTVYRYQRSVRLQDHRLMLRPRDSHDLRLIETNLVFSPPATVRWIHDVFGNSIAIASFAEPSAELRIESSLKLETYVVERPVSRGGKIPIHLFCGRSDRPWQDA